MKKTSKTIFPVLLIVWLLANSRIGLGDGLRGEYYDNKDFTNLKVTRVDATVNFAWGLSSPASSIGPDAFSVRWTGQVQARFSESYRFYTKTDDGVRLWVNGRLIVDKWVDQNTENSGTITLTAGQKYDIKMEYYENGAGATAQLSWSSPSQPKQIIPSSQLFSSSSPTDPPPVTDPPPPPSTSGNTYYVATSGNDSNPCSSTSPCRTIKRGVARAILPGDTVIVKAGTYVESVITWSSGTKGNPITVRANSGDTVIWRGSSTSSNNSTGAVYIQNQRFIRIQGFRFEGSVTKTTIYVVNSDTSKASPVQGIEIINNTFVNNGNNGIQSTGSASKTIYFVNTGHSTFDTGDVVNTISGNTFDSNYGYNVLVSGSNDTVISKNTDRNARNSLEHNFGYYVAFFLQLGGGSTRNVVESNVVSDFKVDSYVGSAVHFSKGVKLDAGASRNIIRRNLIHDFGKMPQSYGIMTESSCNYNEIYENRIYNVGTAYNNGSLATNPSQGNLWKNNVAFSCNCGMRLSRSKDVVVKNNIFFNNTNAQIWVSSYAVANGGNVFSYNDYSKAGSVNVAVWNTTLSGCTPADKSFTQWTTASGDKNSLSVDPKFVSPPSGFQLQSGSPVKDKGEGGVDMGAYPGNLGPGLTISLNGPVQLSPLSSTSNGGQDVKAGHFAWRTVSPEAEGLDSSRLDTMADALANRNTRSLLVIKNDRLVYEWYQPGRDATQPHLVASLAKSLVGGVSLMVALNDGRIGLDDPASKYIPGWREDPLKSKIRIWHLASDTSGIEDAAGPEEWKSAFWKRVPDPFSIALNEAPVLFSPGSDSAHSNPGMAALAYAVTASLGKGPSSDILGLLRGRIMDPLGVPDKDWSIGYGTPYQLDGMKLYATWGGAAFTPRAVAKVGLLMLHKGNWEGKQLIDSIWVNKMVSRATPISDSGLGWWTNLDGHWQSLPRDAFAGAGSGHQVLLVVPSLNLIVVRNGGALMNEHDFWAGLEEYIFDPLMRAMQQHLPSKTPAGVLSPKSAKLSR